MQRIKAALGIALDWILGPRTVEVYRGAVHQESYTLKADTRAFPEKLSITSRKIVYLIRHHYWWIPNYYRCVYTVCCDVAEEGRSHYDPALFIPQSFPNLCNHFMRDDCKPHEYAIHAFLDQFLILKPERVEA